MKADQCKHAYPCLKTKKKKKECQVLLYPSTGNKGLSNGTPNIARCVSKVVVRTPEAPPPPPTIASFRICLSLPVAVSHPAYSTTFKSQFSFLFSSEFIKNRCTLHHYYRSIDIRSFKKNGNRSSLWCFSLMKKGKSTAPTQPP